MSATITPTQRKILVNALEGRPLHHGRPCSRASVGYWNCAVRSCQRKGWLDERTDQLTEKGRGVLDKKPLPTRAQLSNKKPLPTRVQLSNARLRILLYMVQNDVKLVLGKNGTAWTDDGFRWPVAGSTVGHLIKAGFLQEDARERERDLLVVSALGFRKLKEKVKHAVAAQERAARLAGDTPTPLEQHIRRTLADG